MYANKRPPRLGQLTLRSLRLKKGALDKFRLPVDVIEGSYAQSEWTELSALKVVCRPLGKVHTVFTLDEPWEPARGDSD